MLCNHFSDGKSHLRLPPLTNKRAMSRLLHLMLLLSLARPATPLAAVPSAGSISVCTNKACRKSGSLDTLRLLRSLASTVPTPVAASQIDSCGCLGNCGMGPNVYGEKTAEVFRDVYKPKSARALLEEELGLEVSDEAVKASVNRMYAERAMRAGKLDEAVALLTEALNTAGALRFQGAVLLAELLHLRADCHGMKRDSEAAEADRERAESLLKRLKTTFFGSILPIHV